MKTMLCDGMNSDMKCLVWYKITQIEWDELGDHPVYFRALESIAVISMHITKSNK